MTREEAIESFKCSNEQAKLRLEVEKMRMDSGEIKELEFYIERDELAIKALEQEPKIVPIAEITFDDDMLHEIVEEAIKNIEIEIEPKTGHCEDCKCFRKLSLRTDTVGECIQHWGVCPTGDWYCADFDPQESEE